MGGRAQGKSHLVQAYFRYSLAGRHLRLERGAVADSCRRDLSTAAPDPRPHSAPPTPALAAKTCFLPLREIPGGCGVPSLAVLDLRNSSSLQIGDYIRGSCIS